MASPVADLGELRKFKVVELREKLSKLGLPTSGLKADLVERLHKYIKENVETKPEPKLEPVEMEIKKEIGSPPPSYMGSPSDRSPYQYQGPSIKASPQQQPPSPAHQRGPPPQLMSPQHMQGPPPAPGPENQMQMPPHQIHQAPPQTMQQQMSPPNPQQLPPPLHVVQQQQQQPSHPPPMLQQGPPPPQQAAPHPGQDFQQHPHGPPPTHQIQQGLPPPGPLGHGIAPPQGAMVPSSQHQPGLPPHQDVDMQERMIQQQHHLMEQEQQQQQQRMSEQQRVMEQQQKERLAIQHQAMLLQQQKMSQGSAPPAPVSEEPVRDEAFMEKVRQQQMMLEAEKQQERLEQQQQVLREQQNQVIQQQEEERRRNEAELLRQQQIALMEAQRDEQQQRMREEQQRKQQQQQMQQQNVSQGPPAGVSSAPASVPQAPPLMGQTNNLLPHGAPPSMTPPPAFRPSVPLLASRPPVPGQEPMPRPSAPGPRPQENQGQGQQQVEEKTSNKQEAREIRLPHALEKVLAFKDVRAQEVGMTAEELEDLDKPQEMFEDEKKIDNEEEDVTMNQTQMNNKPVDEVDTAEKKQASSKESKNKKKKKKKKKAKKNREEEKIDVDKSTEDDDDDDEVHIEYIPEQLDLDPTDPNYFTFAKIFETFKITEQSQKDKADEVPEPKKAEAPPKPKGDDDDDDSDEDMDDKPDDDVPKMSKKKYKKMTRMSVAQLKQLVIRPDVVEMHDVTAADPIFLANLKATRNTVPVPRHWCFKRKYLQGKRGIEKTPFELPNYIQATGITEMRQALAEKEDQKNLKAKMREKVRPKMGKIDIDYQKLHDAFFKWQVKPKMTIHGDLYYEGKEFETCLKEKKPGNLTDELRTALGMPIGHTADKVPPPWLIAMQRYGPPPSYPNLKIAGLNAPIPEGCSFGYHAGGWGKPPVDENGKPLYGDVFGTQNAEFQSQVTEDEIDKSHWGELESESESEEESEEESEAEEDDTGLITPAEGLVTPSGITSIPVGMETPDMIELRKKRIEDAMDQGGETPSLYTVLPEKKSAVGGAMMGSAHIYDVAAGVGPGGSKRPGDKGSVEGIEVALNPEELDLDSAAMQAKYDQTMREQQSQLEKEDLSDMVAEHAAKQKKRKKQQQDSGKSAKKYKEFKF